MKKIKVGSILFGAVLTVVSAISQNAFADVASKNFYKCINALDLSERFDIHQSEIYSPDTFEFSYNGKKYNLGKDFQDVQTLIESGKDAKDLSPAEKERVAIRDFGYKEEEKNQQLLKNKI